jgi:hypothetical protein
MLPIWADPTCPQEHTGRINNTRIDIRHLGPLLASLRPSDAAYVSVVDGAGRVVSAAPEAETSRLIGEPVRDWHQQAIRANPEGGLARGTSLLGFPVIAAIQPIPTTHGWVVTVSAPLNTYEAL